MKALNIGDSFAAADGRHRAFVDIAEILARRAVYVSEDVFCGRRSHLHRGWTNARHRLAVLLFERGHIANHENIFAARNCQVGLNKYSPRLVGFDAQCFSDG